MPDRPEASVFLERRSYRRRRLLDGLKLLPFVAAWLFMLPLLWPDGGAHSATSQSMSSALIYVFSVWFVMIVIGGALIAAQKKVSLKGKQDASEEPDP